MDIPIPFALSLDKMEHKKASEVNITDITQPIPIKVNPVKFGL